MALVDNKIVTYQIRAFPGMFWIQLFSFSWFTVRLQLITGFLDGGLVTRWAQLLTTLLIITYSPHQMIKV